MTKHSGSKFAVGAFFGAIFGAIAGLLFAPRSGKETRADLKQRAETTRGTASERAEEIKQKAKEATDEAREQADELKERVKNAATAAKQGFEHDVEKDSKRGSKSVR